MAAAPVDDHISSPTLSMTSSFVMLSDHHSSGYLTRLPTSSDDSDDEIVYSVSESPLSPFNTSSPSDDDFVVLSRPRSPRAASQSGLSTTTADGTRTPNTELLADDLANLTVTDVGAGGGKQQRVSPQPSRLGVAKIRRKGRAARKAAAAKVAMGSYPSPAPSPAKPKPPSSATQQVQPKGKLKSGKKAKKAPVSLPGFTTRPIVDDVSEGLSVNGETESVVGAPSVYEEAVGYITSYVPAFQLSLFTITFRFRFLSNPAARNDTACRLTLLQALIIELGLATPSLPASLTSATAFLKSHAFLNIKEYLAVRGQGPTAVRRIMYPSRSALIKDIRKKKNRASLQWVKESGLQVLLVSCYH